METRPIIAQCYEAPVGLGQISSALAKAVLQETECISMPGKITVCDLASLYVQVLASASANLLVLVNSSSLVYQSLQGCRQQALSILDLKRR